MVIKKYSLKPGHLTITRPWQPHSLGNPHIGPNRLHCIILDVEVRRPHQSWNWPDWIILTRNDLKQLTALLETVVGLPGDIPIITYVTKYYAAIHPSLFAVSDHRSPHVGAFA